MSEGVSPEDEVQSASDEQEQTAPGFFDILYGIMFRPRVTFADERITDQSAVHGLIVIILVSVLSGIWHTARDVSVIWEYGSFGTVLFIVAEILLGIIIWIVLGGLVGAVFELMGHQGSVRNLLAWYGLANIPRIFEVPARYLLGPVAEFVVFGIIVWALVLAIVAGKKVYRATTGAAVFATVIVPPLFGGITLASAVIMALVYLQAVGIPDFLTLLP